MFLAQQHLSETLMVIEPEFSLGRREAIGGGLRGAVIDSTDTDRACAHNPQSDSSCDSKHLLDGWHDHLRPADDRQHLVLLTASTESELAHTGHSPGSRSSPCRPPILDKQTAAVRLASHLKCSE